MRKIKFAFILLAMIACGITAKAEIKVKADTTVFIKVEKAPLYPGGYEAFYYFLGKNIRYPTVARDNETQGKVIIKFIVEVDGSLSHLKVSRGIGDGCDEEAIRVLGLSPKWNPGVKNGRVVRTYYSIPITFALIK